MTVLRKTSIFLLAFFASNTQAQDRKLNAWKTQIWNLSEDKKDEIIRMDPAATEFVLSDDDMWKRPTNSDTSFTLFAIRPSYLGFEEGYNHNDFMAKAFAIGYTTPPKSAVAQLYIESEDLSEPVYFPTIPVRDGNKSCVYAVGPNKKGSTPTKKQRDLFLRELVKYSHLEVWIFALSKN